MYFMVVVEQRSSYHMARGSLKVGLQRQRQIDQTVPKKSDDSFPVQQR